MTAIAAVLTSTADAASWLDVIRARLAPFGGDRAEAWSSAGVGLAVCQRRTLPEDRYDREPHLVDDVALAADVRLDDRAGLAHQLGIDADTLSGLSDTALLRRAWERWGRDAPGHLVGDYAFVVWSARDRTLFAARDPIGRRPLCYARTAGGALLASVPAALAGIGGAGAALDEIRVAQRLAAIPPDAGRTYFSGIASLPAGHTLVVSADRVEVTRYWRWGRRPVRYRRSDDYVEHARELFDAAVRSRLRASVPVCSLLSGGIDSAAVTATAALMRADAGERLRAVTWRPHADFVGHVPAGRFADESAAAARTAALYANVDHLVIEAPAGCILEPLRVLADLGGEPIRFMINTTYLLGTSRFVEAGAGTVVLGGQYGNLTISYGGPPPVHRWLVRLLRHTVRRGRSGDGVAAIAAEFARQHRRHLRRLPESHDSVVERRRRLEWKDVGVSDAALSAGFGLEFRDPTADMRLVDFCLSIPDAEFARRGERRRLARRALRGRVPDATLDATSRGMQSLDWPRYVVPYRDEFIRLLHDIEGSPLARRAVNVDAVRAHLERWPDWRTASKTGYVDHFLRAMSMADFIVRHERRGAV